MFRSVSSLVLSLAVAASVQADTIYTNDESYESGTLGKGPYQTFYSSSLTPSAWNFYVAANDSALLSPGHILTAPRGTDVLTPGPLIHTQNGALLWSGIEVIGQTMSFEVTTYNNQTVLATWTGSFNSNGFGSGRGLILDNTYSVIGNVSLVDVYDASGVLVGADFHDFQITANNTALMTGYQSKSWDLSTYSISEGYIWDGLVQEVDIATNELIFSWIASDHITPGTCYSDPGSTGSALATAWDWFHVNSVDKDSAGNYLISSRHCHALYYVDGSSGDVLWTLGGNASSFVQGDGTEFEWQHDGRWRNNETQISVFDNAGTSWESDADYARGLIIDVDVSSMTANLSMAYLPWNKTVSQSQGNVQVQDNGNVLVGWGQVPEFAEFDTAGNIIYGVQFGVGNVQGYRAYRSQWTGFPNTLPDVSIFPNGTTEVFVSWNGATEVESWDLYGSDDASTATLISSTTKSGFETSLTPSNTTYAWYQVAGLDSNGAVLGTSSFYASNGTTTSSTVNATSTATASGASATESGAAGSSSSGGGVERLGGGALVVGLGLSGLIAVGLGAGW
ncbi:ASST-domain-containing protein [Mrakia frigida]|uniref:arylsulfotransferase family protein n=1 Tax=Mrakia frigida TaxID=29902 RepID=UPI003FCC24DA